MTTPTPRWTAETEELVARTLHAAEHAGWRSCAEEPAHEQTSWFVDRCRLVLTALADAGVLMPVGGETRQEWGVRGNDPPPEGKEWLTEHQTEAKADEHLDWMARIYPDFRPYAMKVSRTVVTTPWREVTDDPA